jgi:plastocyanin
MVRDARVGRFARSLLLLPLALAGCGLNGPAHTAKPDGAAVVEMGFTSFNPAVIHIKEGQTVEWRNTSLIAHTVTDDKSLATNADDAAVPKNASSFNSGDIPAGEVFRHTFTAPGAYKYFCTHHEDDGMVATIIVDRLS